MRAPMLALAMCVLAGGWLAAPPSTAAACAGTATLDEIAQEPGAAVFTGRATTELPSRDGVAFAVERWFLGSHAARVVALGASSATIVEPPSGVAGVARAETVSGDAISLVRDEPVLMIAVWRPELDAFEVRACSVAGVELDTADGRAALQAAQELFGPGRPTAQLPHTDAIDPGPADEASAPFSLRDWWPLLLAFALAATLVDAWHRTRSARRAAD